MSVEEMMDTIEECIQGKRPNPMKLVKITAALRAGQTTEAVLRHAVANELLLDGTAKRSVKDWAVHALQAWDAATKG